MVCILECDHFTGARIADDTICVPIIGALRRECEGTNKPYGRVEGACERGERLRFSDCSFIVRVFQVEMNPKKS